MPSALLTLAAVLSAARSSQAAIQLPPVVAGGVRAAAHAVSMRPSRAGRLTLEEKDSAPPAPPGVPPRSSYNLKQVADKQGAGGGAGFNVGLVDPIASATGFVSRRFGLAGGLAVVGLLAATEGREIVAALLDKGPAPGDGKLVTTPSGLQYVELLIGSGDTPLPGTIVGVDTVVSIGGKVLYDTKADKKLAFKMGQRPFQSVVCEGVEEGLKGMRPGGKRTLFVPKDLAPKGVSLPDGVPLEYQIELLEVLPGYF
mmetsp:Transcript_37689/g.121129  ORF Transcript_37689/g.121129 Transcript_37689/m.121129 type:complete len:256 (-) Transcript_37689:296-1063(-)